MCIKLKHSVNFLCIILYCVCVLQRLNFTFQKMSVGEEVIPKKSHHHRVNQHSVYRQWFLVQCSIIREHASSNKVSVYFISYYCRYTESSKLDDEGIGIFHNFKYIREFLDESFMTVGDANVRDIRATNIIPSNTILGVVRAQPVLLHL